MPAYFASDMHLRLDRPDRARRLAQWVGGLNPDDTLHLLGDVCDFWYATRQIGPGPLACEGLRALASFGARGGTLTAMVGNHDLWLGPYYRRVLGAEIVEEPQVIEAYGLRFYLTHGHRAGGRQVWKSGMESRAFFEAFRNLPGPVAIRLDRALEGSNDKGRADDEARLVDVYRRTLTRLIPGIDVAVFGHVHSPVDDRTTSPRMVVLGGWHSGSSFLRVDEHGAKLTVIDPARAPVPA